VLYLMGNHFHLAAREIGERFGGLDAVAARKLIGAMLMFRFDPNYPPPQLNPHLLPLSAMISQFFGCFHLLVASFNDFCRYLRALVLIPYLFKLARH
jgi:hypothetical protein